MSKTRMGKRVASLLLSLVMMLSLLPTTVYAEGADTGDTTDEIVGQATTSGDNTEGTGEPEPTGEGEDGSANVAEGADGAATNDAVVEETIAPVNAEGVDAVANAESSGDEVSGEDGNKLVNFVTVKGDDTKYETLEKAIEAATPDETGVITYNISGKVDVTATGWIQVAKAGLTDLTAVKFVGKTVDAGICINGGLAILADQNYDIDVSFEALTLSKQYPTYGGDYGHSTNYFTTWLRNSNAAENTVTYTNCTFPNGVSNNQYGKTVFDNCKFTNGATGLYNLWSYGGNTEVKNSTFTGVRGIKTYNEGTLAVAPTVKVENTTFTGLSEKAAIVASKATDITLTNVSANNCSVGLFQKAIEGSSNEEEVVIAPSGTNVSGTFVVDGNKGVSEADKRNFNISAGTFTSKVSSDYLAEGLTIGEDGTVTPATTNAVAQIGNTEYTTLADAIAAANAGDTVTLLRDCSGNGIVVGENRFTGKGLTVDFAGHTYTVGGVLVGSATTGTNAFQLLQGNKITFKNGTIAGVAENTKPAEDTPNWHGAPAIVIQNYCDLTLKNMTVSGGDETVYTMSNNCGNVVIENTTINAGKAKGYTSPAVAFDVCRYSSYPSVTVTVKGNSVINGDVEVSGTIGEGQSRQLYVTGGKFTGEFKVSGNVPANITVSGGTFTSAVPAEYCADGFIPTKNADGTYGVKNGSYVAEYNGTKYESLAEAITAAESGATVTLLADCASDRINLEEKSITVDLNGKTLTSTAAYGVMFCAKTGNTITINGTAEGSKLVGTLMVTSGTNGHIVINDGTYESDKYCPIYINGAVSTDDSTLTVTNATIEALAGSSDQDNGVAVYLAGYSTSTFTNTTITAPVTGLEIRAGKLTLTDCNVTGGNGTVAAKADGNGSTVANAAVAISQHTTKKNIDVTINGGTYTATAAVYQTDVQKTGSENVKASIESGMFNGTVSAETNNTVAVSGGSFSSAVPENCCANGYIPTKNESGTYGVKEGSYVAETNNVKYETLQAAIDAAARKATVTMLADTKENVTISTPYLTLDLNGFTLNGSTGERKPALTITARVTVKDSSVNQTGTIMREDTAGNSGVSSHYVIDVQDGWLTFESGIVQNDSGNAEGKGASLVRVGDDSVKKYPGLTIKGGTFTQDNFIAIKVDRGTLYLNDGEVNSANSYAIENWHNATIKGGTVNGTVAAWTYSGGHNSTLEISGGTIKGNVASVSYDKAEGKLAKVSITGGTVTGTLGTYTYNNGLESITDAAKATIEITGGTFSSDPSAYLVESSSVTKNSDGTFGVAKAYLARIGETFYYTMEDAFQAQTNGDTIVLLRDYTTGGTFNSGSINRTVDLNDHTWTCTGTDANSAAFEINYPNASLTVKNGKIVSSQLVGLIPSASGGTITYDNSSLTFENVKMSTTATSGIETNGNNTSDAVTLKDSTLNVPNGFGIYFPSSGKLTIDNSTITAKTMGVQVCAGSLSINAGSAITVSGDAVSKTENDGAIQDGAAISIVNRTGYKGLGNVTVTGGTFKANGTNAAIKAYKWENQTASAFDNSKNVVAVSGGTFSSAVPEGLCAEGYISVANANGTHTVKEGVYVAQVGSTKYESLAAAIGAAQDSDTVTLLKDIDLPATAVVKGKTITLDLNGKTISNSTDIWNESKYAWSLISVRDNGDLTINDTTGGGTLKAKENDCFALDVYAYDTKNVEDTKLTINAGNYVGNISAVYAFTGKATINGGHFSIQQKKDDGDPYRFTLNCYDANRANGTAKIIVNGGTFTNFDPRNNKAEGTGTSFVAEGVGVNSENGTFTAVPNMAAQIIAAGGGSVAAYAGHYDAIAAAKDGETVILLSDRKNNVTNTINANITIDLNGKTLSFGNNKPFFRTNGEVTIQNGTITSNYSCVIVNAYNKLTLKNVKITGVTGDSGKNLVNVCSNAEVTIDKDTVLTASGSGVAVFIGQAADAKYTLNVYGKVIQQNKSYAISGNGSYKGTTTINIYDGAEVRSASVAIYHPQAGEINVYGGLVEGYCGIGIKSGTLNITGGQVLDVGDDDELSDKNSNPNGMTYDGSAIIIDSRRTGYAGNVKINISGDALVQSSYSTAIREIGESAETTNVTALNVTGGKVLGASGKAAIQLHGVTADVTSISGGTFSSKVPAEYCAPGYVPTGEGADGRFTVKEGEFTVQVTSDTTTGTGSMATVSGGGKGSINSAVEVSAPAVSGYTFVGWYLNSYNGKKLSDQPKYTYNPTADCTLVAVYEPISGGTFKLTVDGQGINVNNVAQGNHYLAYLAVGSEITLECTNDNFMFWVNSSDNIVSTNKVLTITLVGDSAYRAVTADNGNDFALVIFKNTQSSGGQELSAAHYTSESTISFPANPSLYGRTFKNWAFMDATNTVVTESAIRERIKDGAKSIIVVPVFEATGTYAVTVQYVNKADAKIADPTVSKSEPTGAMIKVEAQEITGYYFSHWTDESGKVVLSTKQTYVVCAVTNTTIKAVYVTNESDKEQAADKVTLTTNASKNGAKWRVTLVMNYAITDDHTILQRGFLYWPTNTDLSVENKGYLKYREWDSKTSSNNGATVLNLNTSNPDRMIYARAYVIVKDASGNQQTIYSEPIAVSYNIIIGATGN